MWGTRKTKKEFPVGEIPFCFEPDGAAYFTSASHEVVAVDADEDCLASVFFCCGLLLGRAGLFDFALLQQLLLLLECLLAELLVLGLSFSALSLGVTMVEGVFEAVVTD